MVKPIFYRANAVIKSAILLLSISFALFASTNNLITFFGPTSYSPGLTGSKTFKLNVAAPVGSSSQINALLSIKNGDGTTLNLQNCSKLQLTCLLKNLLVQAEILLLRPTSLTVTINNSVVLSKNNYDPKVGVIEKPIIALRNNTLEIRIQGSFLSSILLSAKALTQNLPPLADFTFTGTDFVAPATVNFSGILSRDQDSGYIASYEWNFEDGQTASGVLATHIFTSPGSYLVSLSVTDNGGEKGVVSKTVIIKENQKPTPIFSGRTNTALGDLIVSIDGTESFDSDGTIVEYKVNWGDSEQVEISQTSAKFEHVYLKAGTYQISFLVKDNRGATASNSLSVVVQDTSAPVIAISSPLKNSVVRGNVVSVSISSNEKLNSAKASLSGGQETTLEISTDGLKASGQLDVIAEGENSLLIVAADRNNNSTNSYTNFIASFNKLPSISFNLINPVTIGDMATFDAGSSKDADGTIVKYIWDFQDGSEKIETQHATIQHAFNAGGNFDVTLTAIDNEGGSSTLSNRIFVNSRPSAEFVYALTQNELEYSFDASSSSDPDSQLLSYKWTIDNGDSVEGKTIVYKFSAMGSHSVSLHVSDGLVTETVTKSVLVSTGNEDPESGLPSLGTVTLENDLDKKLSSSAQPLKFNLSGASFHPEAAENSKIFINGNLIEANLVASSSTIDAGKVISNGKNEIELLSIDTEGREISFETIVWAGNENLDLNVLYASGVQSGSSVFAKLQLFENSEIAASVQGTHFENIPNERYVVTVSDELGNMGTEIVNKGETLKQVVLFKPKVISTIDNNSFTNDLAGWEVEGAIPSRNIHLEEGEVFNQNFDLEVESSNAFSVFRAFKPPANTLNVNLRFKMTGVNVDDSYVVTARGLESGSITIDMGDLSLAASEESKLTTGWIDSSINLAKAGEAVEIKISVFPAKAPVAALKKTGQEYLKVAKSFFAIFFAQQVSAAADPTNTTVNLTVDQLVASPLCVNSVRLVDYTPAPGAYGEPLSSVDVHYLKVFSIGKLPSYLNGGVNTIAARVKICPNSSVARWDLEADMNGKKYLLATSTGPLIPAYNNSFDIKFNIKMFGGVDILEKLANDRGQSKTIGLNLRARSQIPENDITPFIFSSGIPSKTAFYNIVLRKEYPETKRFGLKRDTDIQPPNLPHVKAGGDEWTLPFIQTDLDEMLEENPNLRFNDISNMNGGRFDHPKGHTRGQNIDFRVVGAIGTETENNPSPAQLHIAAKELTNFVGSWGNIVEKVIFTHPRPLVEDENLYFEPDTSKIVWNHIRPKCEARRLMRKIILTDTNSAHKEHFHAEFKETQHASLNDTVGGEPLLASSGPNKIISFNKPLFTFQNGLSYEAYIERTINGIKEFYPVENNFNASNFTGVVKIKTLKIRKLPDASLRCDEGIQSLSLVDFDERADEVEYAYLHVKPEGVCNGAFMKPVRGEFEDMDLAPEQEVGWLADGASIDDANIGSGVYVCPGSSIKEKSKLIAGDSGFIEIKNSTIAGKTLISGNVAIENSVIDHTDLTAGFPPGYWSDQGFSTKITNADITDKMNEQIPEGSIHPILIYGNVEILGSETNRVKISRTVASAFAGDVKNYALEVSGTHIHSITQKLRISDGANISDSMVFGSHNPVHTDLALKVDSNSIIEKSIVAGYVTIENNAQINSTLITEVNFDDMNAPKLFSISEASIASSTLEANGSIRNTNTQIKNSSLLSALYIDLGSNISDSTVFKATILGSKVKNNASVSNTIVRDDSEIDDSNTSGSSSTTVVSASKVLEKSIVGSSRVLNKSEIKNSYVSLDSTIENSKVTNSLNGGGIQYSSIVDGSNVTEGEIFKSTISSSTVNSSWINDSTISLGSIVLGSTLIVVKASDSTLLNMNASGITIVSSNLTGPGSFFDDVSNSNCSTVVENGESVFKCYPKTPNPPSVP